MEVFVITFPSKGDLDIYNQYPSAAAFFEHYSIGNIKEVNFEVRMLGVSSPTDVTLKTIDPFKMESLHAFIIITRQEYYLLSETSMHEQMEEMVQDVLEAEPQIWRDWMDCKLWPLYNPCGDEGLFLVSVMDNGCIELTYKYWDAIAEVPTFTIIKSASNCDELRAILMHLEGTSDSVLSKTKEYCTIEEKANAVKPLTAEQKEEEAMHQAARDLMDMIRPNSTRMSLNDFINRPDLTWSEQLICQSLLNQFYK